MKWFEVPIEIDQIDASDVAEDANSDRVYEEDCDGEVDESDANESDGDDLTF
jgi:hypothetical protein